MAQKRKQPQRKMRIEDCSLKMQEHIRQLGIPSVEAYREWCRTHNFNQGIDKNRRQRQAELYALSRMHATRIMVKEKKERNLKEILPRIYRKELQPENLQNTNSREIAAAFQESDTPEVLLKLLLYLEDNTDLLKDATYIQGIAAFANHYKSWIRPLEEWHVKRHNRDRQFSQLARHLFAAYDVPRFMDQAWFSGNETHQGWFKHIGAGQNIRTAPDIPLLLTKKMAHHFLKAPKQYTFEEAFRWGQVHGLGGDRRLVDALRGTRLTPDFSNDDFWMSVIRFFIANPMLDVSHVHPIIDYIWNQKYENRRVFVERGVATEIEPAQPNFSMKGRTPDTLLRHVSAWHRELGKEMGEGNLHWSYSDINDFRFQEGNKQKHDTEGNKQKRDMKFWYIRELVSTDELVAEGRAMSHCVRTYAKSCYTGRSSIWTMEVEDENGRRKVLTIEVSLTEKLIRQVRGKRNRLPTLKEKNLLGRWAIQEGLQLAEYI